MLIFCVKCREKTETRDLEPVTMKNGRAAMRGVCVACGTNKFRIGTPDAEAVAA